MITRVSELFVKGCPIKGHIVAIALNRTIVVFHTKCQRRSAGCAWAVVCVCELWHPPLRECGDGSLKLKAGLWLEFLGQWLELWLGDPGKSLKPQAQPVLLDVTARFTQWWMP